MIVAWVPFIGVIGINGKIGCIKRVDSIKFDHILEYFLSSKLGSSFCVIGFHSCRNHWRLKTMGKGSSPKIVKLILR